MIAQEPKAYAKDSSRWYTREGVPVDECIGRNGAVKKPTLREARQEGWVPSVTTILSVMAKPELDNWKLKEVARRCSHATIGEGETEEEYASRMVEQAREEMAVARDKGSEIHSEIDRMLFAKQEQVGTYTVSRYTDAARTALEELGVWDQRMLIESPFCAHGVAGKRDLVGVDERWLMDWKTTSKPLDDGKIPDYDEYCAQLAAYSMGTWDNLSPYQGMNLALRNGCHNIFLSTSNPGVYAIKTWTFDELKRGWAMYACCRELWQLKNDYYFTKG